MGEIPRVSVIMAAFNCESFIEQAIQSVLAQTERNLELVIVDDGSRDSTPAIARRLASADERVRVYAQAPSGRPSVTRNTGLGHARGEYVCFLDADDWYAPTRVQRCLEVFDRFPEAALVFHDMLYVDSSGQPFPGSYLTDTNFQARAKDCLSPVGDRQYRCTDGLYEFMCVNYAAMHTNTVMIRRSKVEELALHFPVDVAIGEDTDLWFRAALALEVVYLDENLSHYRQHGAGITGNRERWFRDLLIVHKRNYLRGKDRLPPVVRHQYRTRIAEMFFSQGYMYWTLGRNAEARQAYGQSLRWSMRAATVTAWIKACLPPSLARWLRALRSRPT